MAKPIPHGTNTGYCYHKCRCDECRMAHNEKGRQFRENNPDYNRQYHENNRERIEENKRLWVESRPGYRQRQYEANRGREAELNRIWREANPEYRRKHYEANREKAADQLRAWREANPEQYRETANRLHSRRRARVRDAFIEDVPRVEIFERDGWQCMIPGCLYPGVPVSADGVWPDPLLASVDHIIPLSRGGLHERSNLACAHLRCNVVKHARVEGIPA